MELGGADQPDPTPTSSGGGGVELCPLPTVGTYMSSDVVITIVALSASLGEALYLHTVRDCSCPEELMVYFKVQIQDSSP